VEETLEFDISRRSVRLASCEDFKPQRELVLPVLELPAEHFADALVRWLGHFTLLEGMHFDAHAI
jgi:hypothetical protein